MSPFEGFSCLFFASVRACGEYSTLCETCQYTEFSPDTLAALCRLVGFEGIRWTADTEVYGGAEALGFFQRRLEALLPALPNEALRVGFEQLTSALREKAIRVGGMEIPLYRLAAGKEAAE